MNQTLRTMHTETVRISPAAQEAVTEFRGEFFFLSNSYYAPITYMGQRYANNEAAFQAQKTRNPNKRKEFTIQNLQHPGDAKRLGRHLQLREDWEEIKLEQMYNICMAKFFQHPDLREKLLKTCCCPLFEGNTWGDRYWGTVNGYGENHLGIILMDIRAKLQNELVYHADMMA